MPISDCEVRDPRVRRTRQLLHAALRALLTTRPFEEISVQEIADAATVNRATFYDHYTDKYALLEAMVAGSFHRLLEERSVHYDASCPSAAAALVRATCDYLVTLAVVQQERERLRSVAALEDAALVAAIRRVLATGMATHSTIPAKEQGFRSAAAAGAICGAAKEWLGLRRRPTPEEIVPQIVALVWPLLAGEPGMVH